MTGTEPLPSDAATRGFERGTARDRGFEHVAKFLLLLGGEAAAQVLARLTAGEVTGIIREVARTGHIEQREARRVLEEFGYVMETRELYARGGAAAAAALLQAGVGAERAAALLARQPAPWPDAPAGASGEQPGASLLAAAEAALRQAAAERSDRQLACALAAAAAPVARRLRACLSPPRRAAVDALAAGAAGAAGAPAAVRAGALRALERHVELQQQPAEEPPQ